MRELKFRAWGKDCRRFEYFEIGENEDCYGMFRVVANKFGSVVEQYTGLKDKNGKEIYEGDIVKQTYSNLVYPVRFEYGGFLPFTSDMMSFDNDYCEVIGNIHENPELLGGEE